MSRASRTSAPVWRVLAVLIAAVLGLGVLPSGLAQATPVALADYAGATISVTWQLAPGVNASNIRTYGKDKRQTYYGATAPSCTKDGTTSFQADVYKYDKVHKPLVDALIRGGVLYLWPRTPNDSQVILKWAIVTPEKCKPTQPVPTQVVQTETKKSCDGVYERTITTTTPYVWDAKRWKWVPGTPVVGPPTPWKFVRFPTNDEVAALGGCNQPKAEDTVKTEEKKSCDGVFERTITTTTPYVWDQKSGKWVPGTPVVGPPTPWKFVRFLTADEVTALGGCNRGNPSVLTKTDFMKSCNGLFRRTITTTVTPVWDQKSGKWVPGTPVVQASGWVKVRDLTNGEKVALKCVAPPPFACPPGKWTDDNRDGKMQSSECYVRVIVKPVCDGGTVWSRSAQACVTPRPPHTGGNEVDWLQWLVGLIRRLAM